MPDAFGGTVIMEKLEKFLSKSNSAATNTTNTSCVYLGWGSMVSHSPQYMTEFAVRALMEAKVRGVILEGWAGLAYHHLEDPILRDYADESKGNILFVTRAPHEWLFSRVDLTVHHGGSGTTAAALRSGKPTIVTPVFLDQWDHAYVINQLKCGYGFERHQLQSISSQQLAKAITTTLSDTAIAVGAQQVGEMLQKEQGAKAASEQMEAFWKEITSSRVNSNNCSLVG